MKLQHNRRECVCGAKCQRPSSHLDLTQPSSLIGSITIRLLAALVRGVSLRDKGPLRLCDGRLALLPEDLVGHSLGARDKRGKIARGRHLEGKERRMWKARLDLALACLMEELSLERRARGPFSVAAQQNDDAGRLSQQQEQQEQRTDASRREVEKVSTSSQLDRIETALARLESRTVNDLGQSLSGVWGRCSDQTMPRSPPISPTANKKHESGALGLHLTDASSSSTTPKREKDEAALSLESSSKDDWDSSRTRTATGPAGTRPPTALMLERGRTVAGHVSNETIAVLLVVLICAVLWRGE